MRAFVAVQLPEWLKANVARVQASLKWHLRAHHLRWASTRQLHLTLKFLGEVDEEAVPEMTANLEMAVAAVSPFTLSVGGFGCFPDGERPRVCWLGVEGAVAELTVLQQRVEEALLPWSPQEARPFVPHLTLARVTRPVRGLRRDVAALPEAMIHETLGSWEVKAVDFMRSVLLPQGARHELVKKVGLEGEAK